MTDPSRIEPLGQHLDWLADWIDGLLTNAAFGEGELRVCFALLLASIRQRSITNTGFAAELADEELAQLAGFAGIEYDEGSSDD